MSAIQGPLFQRSARARAAEFDLCLNAMNLLDLGVPAVHFLADLDWLAVADLPSTPTSVPAKRVNISAMRRLYHALSAGVQARSGRDLLHEDTLVANSEWVASSLRAMGIKSSVIYPPVPWASPERDWEKRRNDFVWIGRIDPSKKLENAVKIVAGLRNAGIDCAIHIVGTAVDKNYFGTIRALAEQMGEWVILKGPLYGEDKAAFLSQFRYAIHTRTDEPFGITLVELMKAGCIPIAPHSCGSAEILSHPSLLFASEVEAVSRVRQLFCDANLSRSVRSFIRKRAEQFSTDRFCKDVVTLVSAMIDNRSPESDIHPSRASAHV